MDASKLEASMGSEEWEEAARDDLQGREVWAAEWERDPTVPATRTGKSPPGAAVEAEPELMEGVEGAA